jgi:hypothetical protein
MLKKEFARHRNWAKLRLTGFNLDTKFLSTNEKRIYAEIQEKMKLLKDYWDEESMALGMELKPHKCHWCGKRSNQAYMDGDNNYCKKHFEEINSDHGTNPTSTAEV